MINEFCQVGEGYYFCYPFKDPRDVAQPGSALRSGRRGRRFESCHPDPQEARSKAAGFVFSGAWRACSPTRTEKQNNPDEVGMGPLG
jgi:hypothetical protein